MGIPSDGDPSDDYLIDERAYFVSYNPVRRVPNWVAWRLDRSYLGHAARRNDFRPNPALPEPFYRVVPHDYAKSGYERGHLCPCADRTDTPDDNSLTFLMTNIQPQVHELNTGPWEKLEEYERRLAQRPEAEIYIVAGGIFGSSYPMIGHGVAVPRANYKVMLALRAGQSPSEVTPDAEAIAVVVPNEHRVGAHVWTEFLTSIDEVERESGYDFFANLPDDVERAVEARVAAPPPDGTD